MVQSNTLKEKTFPVTVIQESYDPTHKFLPAEAYESGKIIKTWTSKPQGVDADYPYEMCCLRLYCAKPDETKDWEYWDPNNIALWAHYGQESISYQLVLDTPICTMFYTNLNNSKVFNPPECSTGTIRLNKCTGITEAIKIDKLRIDDLTFIQYGDIVSANKTFNNLNGWTVTLNLESKKEDNLYELKVTECSLVPNFDSNKILKNNILKLPITVEHTLNNGNTITRTAYWTINAIWDKDSEKQVSMYKLTSDINMYILHVLITEDENGTSLETVFSFDNDAFSLHAQQKESNTAWHDLTTDYKIVLRTSLYGEAIWNEDYLPTGNNYPVINNNQLKNWCQNYLSSQKESDMKGFYLELYVDDLDYNKLGNASYGGFYLADRVHLLLGRIVTKSIKGSKGDKGETGATGATGAPGESTTSSNVSATFNDGVLHLTIDGQTYDIAATQS